MFSTVSTDFGEGWNAYWALAIQKGLPLYSTQRAFTANNYPPLSFYLNALLGRAIGDNILAGRLIALASMAGVAALIARILSTLGAPRRWALLSATIFLLYNLIYFRQMVAIDNPQWLGEFIGLACMIPLVRRPPDALRVRDVVAAAGIMVVAGLVKHNQFALPLAVTAWLLLYNRRACAIWLASGAALAACACLLLYALYGPAVFVEIIHYKRTMSATTFRLGLAKTGSLAALIAVAALSLRWQRGNPRAVLLLLYALCGVMFGIVQRLGSGVFINAHDDAVIGLVLACGAGLGLAAGDPPRRALSAGNRVALLAAILFPIFIVTPKHLRQTVTDVRSLPAQRAVWAAMIRDARQAPDPVFCELLAVCYWADKPLEMDFFAYGERLKTGLDPSTLRTILASRAAPLLVVDRAPGIPPVDKRLPPPFPAMIDRNYEVVRTDANGVAVMRPRPR